MAAVKLSAAVGVLGLSLSWAAHGAALQDASRPQLDKLIGAVGQVVVLAGDASRNLRVEGSGVIIAPEGLVVTSYHVVQGRGPQGVRGVSSEVFFNPADPSRVDFPLEPRKMLRLQFIRAELQRDLALFRIGNYVDGRSLPSGNQFPWLRMGSFDEVKILDPVFAIGFPEVGGETLTVVEGKVAGKDAVNDWIKVDASLSRGYSGGAIVNSRGELIGIATEIRADVQQVEPEKVGVPNVKVLYGIMNWVRPSRVVERLLKPTGPVIGTPAISTGTELIAGRVASSQGQPVAGALVGLLKAESRIATIDNLLSYARTDNAGEFKIRIVPGRYTLRIVAPGYEPKLQGVELKHGEKTLRITLKGKS
jgi:hypothetical protein